MDRFQEIIARRNSRWLGELYLNHVQDVADRLGRAFPDRFADGRRPLRDNVAEIRGVFAARYGR